MHTDKTKWLSPLVLDGGFSVQFRGDHVHVDLDPSYKVSAAQRDRLWARLGAICAEHGTRRVLVEGVVPAGERDTAEVIEAGKSTATVPKLWLAFRLDNFRPTEQTELFEVIAAARGVRVKFFTETDHALKWLRNNTER